MAAVAESSTRIVIAVDYGTTYTGVAWAQKKGPNHEVTLSDINAVQNWPGKDLNDKVPSQISYQRSSTGRSAQWGGEIDENSFVIKWTKLELAMSSRLDALQALERTLQEYFHLDFDTERHVLRQNIPRHLTKSSYDILEDYLERVADFVYAAITSKADRLLLKRNPVDLIITHPAVWPREARNLTFKAAYRAFTRVITEITSDKPGLVYMTTEPEACAHYTLRHAVRSRNNTLQKNDCFILVDAGGGTVDLVSYRVIQLEPFQIERITRPSGAKCGATRIDDFFLHEFLQRHLTPEDFARLHQIGNRHGLDNYGRGAHVVLRPGERFVLEKFMPIKHRFRGLPENHQNALPDILKLPPGIGMRDDPGRQIRNQSLEIYPIDLKEMFDNSVEQTLDMIEKQRTQAERARGGRRVKSIFLSGGFSRSEYLFSQVNQWAQSYGIGVHRGDDSWTAVAKGAALMALGVGCQPPPPARPCPVSIGVILAQRFVEFDHDDDQRYEDFFDHNPRGMDQIKWIVQHGDLILPNEPLNQTVQVVKKFSEHGKNYGRVGIVVNAYVDLDTESDNRYHHEQEGQNTWCTTKWLNYDLKDLSADEKRTVEKVPGGTGPSYYRAEMALRISVTMNRMDAELVFGHPGKLLASTVYEF